MLTILFVGFAALAALAITASIVLTFHAWEHRRFARGCFRMDREPFRAGRIGVIVPCKGIDFQLKENLACLLDQNYHDYEVYFVVEHFDDPACGVIRMLLDSEKRISAQLIVSGESFEDGQKIHNLLCGYQALSPEVKTIVFADCDVAPDRDWLSRLVAPLDKVNVHAVSSYRWFVPQRSSFANLLLFSINAAAMGLVCSRRHAVLWGGSWAVSREVFNGVEMPQRWKSYLSDDLVATARFNRLRLNIYFEPRCVVQSALDYSLAGMWEFLRRQCFMGRQYLPKRWIVGVAHASLSMLAFWGGLLGGGVLALNGHPLQGGIGILTACLLWCFSAIRSRWRQDAGRLYMHSKSHHLQRAQWFDLCCYPLTIAMLWVALCSVAIARCIRWRGITYHLGNSGKILGVDRESTTKVVKGPFVIASSLSSLQKRANGDEEVPLLSLYTDEPSSDKVEQPVSRRSA